MYFVLSLAVSYASWRSIWNKRITTVTFLTQYYIYLKNKQNIRLFNLQKIAYNLPFRVSYDVSSGSIR